MRVHYPKRLMEHIVEKMHELTAAREAIRKYLYTKHFQPQSCKVKIRFLILFSVGDSLFSFDALFR